MSGSPEAMFREALLLDKQGSVLEAMAAYSSVLQRAPRLANAWYNLAVLQRKTRQFAAALASYQQALDHGIRGPEEVHLNRGVIFADDLRQYPAAESELRAALELNPAYIPALFNYANLHEDLGRRDAAGEVYERILKLEPRQYEALSRYANLRKFSSPEDPLIARLRTALAEGGSRKPRFRTGTGPGCLRRLRCRFCCIFARKSRQSSECGSGGGPLRPGVF